MVSYANIAAELEHQNSILKSRLANLEKFVASRNLQKDFIRWVMCENGLDDIAEEIAHAD